MADIWAGEHILWRAALALQEENSQGLHDWKDQIWSRHREGCDGQS